MIVTLTTIAMAAQSLFIAYPPPNHKTTSDRVFFLGTAPQNGNVFINGKVIERSASGHFAPSLPLEIGENIFRVKYQNQELQIKVNRQLEKPEIPVGIAFAKNSLTPAVDTAKLPGELICFNAVAPPNATVSVQLAGQIIPLQPRTLVDLPDNKAVLVGSNSPSQSTIMPYQGCAKTPIVKEGLNLGKPRFQLTLNGQRISQEGMGNISILSPIEFEVAEVIADTGTTRSGASTDFSRLTPLPKGTKASIIGREGEWLQLDYGAWIKASEVRIIKDSVPPKSIIRSVRSRQVSGATEILFPLQMPVPVAIKEGEKTLTLTLYNTTAQTDIIRFDDDPLISRLDWQQIAPSQVQYTFNLKSAQQWGYKLRYEGTTLVLSLRHAPLEKRGEKPLSGMKILLDPGHGGPEDKGGISPTGYREKSVTLIVSKLVRDELIKRGATVIMTREEDVDLDLPPRVAMIQKEEPTIALSIHYNALPDHGDAIKTKGLGTFWYHPQAHSLAMFLHNYLVKTLNRPSYGVYWDNLALTRPAVAPSVLLELGFMINPEEFEWIINPQEQKKLADAIAQGITEWLNQVQ
jgi:N-acetylmuramoyl-L-alanine amidase